MEHRFGWSWLAGFALVLALPGARAADRPARGVNPGNPGRPEKVVIVESAAPTTYESGYKSWVSAGGMLDFQSKRGRGFFAGFGFQSEFIGADIKLLFGSTAYGGFSVDPAPTDSNTFASAQDPASEIFRARTSDDPWGFFLVEPGISVGGKCFISFLPRLSESGRIGMAFGKFSDNQSAIGFTARLISFEGDLDYQLQERGQWGLRASLSWRSGELFSTASPTQLPGRLPVSWVTDSLSVVWWF